MTFTLNKEAVIVHDDFTEMSNGIVTAIDAVSITMDVENVVGPNTPTRILLDNINGRCDHDNGRFE